MVVEGKVQFFIVADPPYIPKPEDIPKLESDKSKEKVEEKKVEKTEKKEVKKEEVKVKKEEKK